MDRQPSRTYYTHAVYHIIKFLPHFYFYLMVNLDNSDAWSYLLHAGIKWSSSKVSKISVSCAQALIPYCIPKLPHYKLSYFGKHLIVNTGMSITQCEVVNAPETLPCNWHAVIHQGIFIFTEKLMIVMGT